MQALRQKGFRIIVSVGFMVVRSSKELDIRVIRSGGFSQAASRAGRSQEDVVVVVVGRCRSRRGRPGCRRRRRCRRRRHCRSRRGVVAAVV